MVAELRESDDPQARDMSASLRPLEQAALERLNGCLPKLSHQVRIGEHDQTAFALGLMLDYARTSGDTKFADLLVSKVRQFYFAFLPNDASGLLTCGCKSSFFARFLRPSLFLLANFALCNMPQGGQHM
jgi:DUF2891 family protein